MSRTAQAGIHMHLLQELVRRETSPPHTHICQPPPHTHTPHTHTPHTHPTHTPPAPPCPQKEADSIFKRLLDLPSSEPSADLTSLPRWHKLEPLLKSYLGNTLHLLGEWMWVYG
jgi:hypothetical protein